MHHESTQAERRRTPESISRQHKKPAATESDCPLLIKSKEVCRLLGGIHARTLARLESRGLIRPVSGLLRHKLYASRDVEALVASLSEWKPS